MEKTERFGDAAGAGELLRESIQLRPDVAAYHVNLAVILKGIGSAEERRDAGRWMCGVNRE